MTTHEQTLTPVARLPQGSPDSWQGFPRWRWVRTPQGYTAACARLRLTAHRRAVLDAITARIWGPQGGRRDRPGHAGDEVEGARWTVRELAAALTSAVGYAIHRTDIHRAVAWLLSHAVIARSPTGDKDASFRYRVRPYSHWTRTATVKPGDPGYPRALRERRRIERERAAQLAEAAERGPGTPQPETASQGPQSAPNEGGSPAAVSVPVLAPFSCGPSTPLLSTLNGDDRAGSTWGSETDILTSNSLTGRGAGDGRRFAPATARVERAGGSSNAGRSAPARARSERAPRFERAASWFVVTQGQLGKAQRVPLWDAVRRLAGDGWARIRDLGPTPADAVEVADALAYSTSQTWAPSAVLDALRLAVTREHEAVAIAEAEEVARIRLVVETETEAGREALRSLPAERDRDPGLTAAADELRKALDALTADRGSGEGELLAVIAADRRREVDRQLGRHIARELAAAREQEARERREAERLRTERGRIEQGLLADDLDELARWQRENPPKVSGSRWGEIMRRAFAKERDRDAVLLWSLRSGHASPDDVAEARRRCSSIEARRRKVAGQPPSSPGVSR